MVNEFKEFIARGNVVDMAVGIAVGAAFGAIAHSLVTDLIMPPVGLLLGGANFADLFVLLQGGDPPPPYASLEDARAAGAVTVNWGLFLNTIIAFLIVAAAVFLLVRALHRLMTREAATPAEPTDKACPFCFYQVPLKATRCPHCTSGLEAA